MRRLALVALGTWACACAATNPDWDDPAASVTGRTTMVEPEPNDASDTTAAGAGTAETDAAATTTTGATTATDASSEPNESSGGDVSSSTGESPCEDHWLRCDGECFDVDDEPLHCGAACVDCRIEFGNDAECKHGECGEGGEGKGG